MQSTVKNEMAPPAPYQIDTESQESQDSEESQESQDSEESEEDQLIQGYDKGDEASASYSS